MTPGPKSLASEGKDPEERGGEREQLAPEGVGASTRTFLEKHLKKYYGR